MTIRLGFRRIIFAALAAAACNPFAPPPAEPHKPGADTRFASGRPPVVVVGREGDPAGAIAVAITTTGVGWDGTSEDPEPGTALAGLVESRLKARAIDAVVVPAWDGLRVSMLVGEADAAKTADAIRDVLNQPVGELDLAPVRRKLAALGQRPLHDKALGRYARCVGEPWGITERAKEYESVDLARIERWRQASFALGHVAIATAGKPALGEAVANAILNGPAWKVGAPIGTRADSNETAVDAFEGVDATSAPAVFVTFDVGSSGAAVIAAEALGDPRGPLAARLADLDPPFRVREVTGAAHARGGCAGVVLESTTGEHGTAPQAVADAAALVRLETNARLAEAPNAAEDGRLVARRSGDAREAAERAAWWALADQGATPRAGGGSVTLVVPPRRGSKDEPSTQLRDALAAAVAKSNAAWDKPVVEARTRIESGQGEAWVLVGSPCGADAESDAEAGISAIFATAAADTAMSARGANGVTIEPWVAVDGVGLLAHGPPNANESPAALARRLADVATRALAAEPIASFNHARAELLRRDAHDDGPAITLLAMSLAPTHASWIDPWGSSEPIARSSDATVSARMQSLRAGPIRIAVLANGDATQADAAVRAADRWVTRHPSDGGGANPLRSLGTGGSDVRQCRSPASAQSPKPGTYLAPFRPGAIPEAYLAYPFGPGDEAARGAAQIVVASLQNDGVLEHALGGNPPLARESSARILGWPRAPALVIRVVAQQAALDNAVMQVRALVDRVRRAGLAQPDFDRAVAAEKRALTSSNLDPRARVVATWRGEPLESAAHVTAEDVRAFAAKALVEDTMVVVTSRPPREVPEKAKP